LRAAAEIYSFPVSFELPPSFWPTLYRLSVGKEWPPESDRDAAPFLARVVREGLLSLLLADATLPAFVAQAARPYEALHRTNMLRARVFEDSLRTTFDAIGDEPMIVLKGTDYAYRLYPSPHLRPRQDIDVLVPRDRAAAIAWRLKRAGFRQHFPAGPVSRLRTYHEMVFEIGNATVEIHHSFIQRTRHRIDYDGVWKRATPWRGFDQRLLQLDEVDALIYHSINMSADQFSTPIFRHLDCWLMLRTNEQILPQGVGRAREWAATHALYGALRQTSRYFPQLATPAVERAMQQLISGRTRAFLDREILPDPWSPRRRYGRPGQLWRKFWLIDDARHRAAFALYHAYAVIAGSLLSQRAARQHENAEKKTGENDFASQAQEQAGGDHQSERRRRIE